MAGSRAATPHALGLPARKSTTSEPFLLVRGGVHHWDENGVFANETVLGVLPPREVERVQGEERRFVRAWMDEWQKKKVRKRPRLGLQALEKHFQLAPDIASPADLELERPPSPT
ncbi:hypothetical protein B0T26DRAFT_755821 [Lasiosphaeria miniovina]|uniref:Uncharacterized protein n=1 Tax=Lasiosphaeria miniovina TaxID=1954250 RepID=A0AA39ZZ35_9PEZI|nr:uncharacterized protein B0T26DRAFT_755821 [Lasiosphaeria miniovina]KAK0706303.1 hypothetical protein B0T26DRAFT_755821 [Lasiosphaeria miniovina]